jgi:hypothetical protein
MANAVPASSGADKMPAADVIKELSLKKASEKPVKLSPKAEDALGLVARPLADGEKIVERNGGVYRERKSTHGKAVLSSRIS